MLVYLDSAHFALLERCAADDVEHFFSGWRDCECELALSLHHLQEIAQLSDAASVTRRMKVLEAFPSVRCRLAGSDLVLKLEIHLALLTILGFSPDVRRSATDTLFPMVGINGLRSALVQMQPLFGAMRAAHEVGAQASNFSKQAEQGTPVNLGRVVTASDLNAPAITEAYEAALADLPPAAQLMMRELADQVRTSVAEQGSVRNALISIYGLADIEAVQRIRDSDLALVSTFFKAARTEVGEVLSRAPLEHLVNGEELVRRLDPYAAPGFALQLAVRRARSRHPKPDEPGDDIDVAHIAFAPYVDLLFVDKRTRGFIAQEVRDNPDLLPPAAAASVEKAGTLDQVVGAITRRYTKTQ